MLGDRLLRREGSRDLYSSQNRLASLHRSDITTHGGRTTISLGTKALLLAPLLDRLACELAAGSASDATTVGLAQSFPAGQ